MSLKHKSELCCRIIFSNLTHCKIIQHGTKQARHAGRFLTICPVLANRSVFTRQSFVNMSSGIGSKHDDLLEIDEREMYFMSQRLEAVTVVLKLKITT